jgi:hypothetical protein
MMSWEIPNELEHEMLVKVLGICCLIAIRFHLAQGSTISVTRDVVSTHYRQQHLINHLAVTNAVKSSTKVIGFATPVTFTA